APDISPITAAQETIRRGEQKVQESIRATGDANAAIAAHSDSIRSKVSASIDKFVADYEAKVQRQREAEQKAADEVVRALYRVEQANLKALQSYQQVATGAFELARGMAFLGASSEKDLRVMIQAIAKVQGAFDIFRGGTDVVI